MKMLFKKVVVATALLSVIWTVQGQSKGNLFIIGGGERSSALIRDMVETAVLREDDYIVVLPMATSVPEESVAYIAQQISAHRSHKLVSFNFDREQADTKQEWIDSVRHARLIYVTGGDQNKFMNVVRDTELYRAMHQAYNQGSTIAGTSAGAAIMSEIMITGSQKGQSETSTFKEVKSDYIATAQGMGFLEDIIIDQHFIMRSRYNRLLSVLADYPKKIAVGIDEGTALVVSGRRARVVGDSQVFVVSNLKGLKISQTGKVSFRDARLSLFSDGQSFKIK